MLVRQLVSLRSFRPLLGAAQEWGRAAAHSLAQEDDDRALDALMAQLAAEGQAPAAAEAAAGAEAGMPWPSPDDGLQPAYAQPEPGLLESAAVHAAQQVPAEQQRLLQVGVMGAPNAGKSTLLNALVGTKVSAVSPKTNTTQAARMGAYTSGDSQVVLYDTPGIVDRQHFKNPAQQQRVRGAWAVGGDCDLLLLLVDAARELQRADPRIERMLQESASPRLAGMPEDWEPPPAVLVLNKLDMVPREAKAQLLPLADRLRGLRTFEDVFFISARKGMGVPELRQYMLGRATPGEWVLDADQPTELTEEEQAMEVVREKLFRRLRKELPYTCQLRLASSLPLPDEHATVRMVIDVVAPSRGAQRIVIGSAGGAIQAIRDSAQRELQHMWGRPVELNLRVVVAK